MRRQRRDVYRPRNSAADDNLVAGAGRRLGVHEDLLTCFMVSSCWLPGCRGNRWFPRWAGEERHGLSVSAARNSSSLAADGVTRAMCSLAAQPASIMGGTCFHRSSKCKVSGGQYQPDEQGLLV